MEIIHKVWPNDDPFTHSRDTWVTASDDIYADLDQTEPGINDVHSGAQELDSEGQPYSSW